MKVNKIIMLSLIVFQLVIVTQLSSCQLMQKEEYEWIPTVGAPLEYPVEIISGEFISINGYSPGLPRSEFVNSGWGDSGSPMIVGPDKKPVPDSLTVTWLSYAENKLYQGRFLLPKESIAALMKTGYIDHEKKQHRGYNYLTLGFSPGGNVVLWLSGIINTVQVASFTANEIKLSTENLGKENAYLLKEGFIQKLYAENIPVAVRERVAKEGIQVNLFKEWLKRYQWKYTVNSKEVSFYELNPVYLNMEAEEIYDDDLINNDVAARAVPKRVDVVWFDKKKQKMSTEIVFDEQEIRSAFARFDADDKGELSFTVNPVEYTIVVSLTVDKKEIKLTKQKSKTSLLSE